MHRIKVLWKFAEKMSPLGNCCGNQKLVDCGQRFVLKNPISIGVCASYLQCTLFLNLYRNGTNRGSPYKKAQSDRVRTNQLRKCMDIVFQNGAYLVFFYPSCTQYIGTPKLFTTQISDFSVPHRYHSCSLWPCSIVCYNGRKSLGTQHNQTDLAGQ